MIYQTGEILNQRYRVVKLLGQGGFGALYRVWDMTLARPCALKQNLDASADMQRQFLREAKILANLNHPNLPRVTDYFIDGTSQYLVMDFVDGQDLQEMLDDRNGSLPEDQVLPWIRQICDALTYMHSQKPPVIHRDIKPGNIKITSSGQAVLVDFGIAKVFDPKSKTTLGAQAVTPGFSPYEQYGKGATDARSDIYALGATLYTLLTAQEPPESVQRVTRDPLQPARQLNSQISIRVSAAIMRALQMDPTQRFQSAADFKAALNISPRVAPPARPAQATQTQPPFYSTGGISTGPSTRLPWVIVAILTVLTLVLVVLALFRRDGNTPPRPSPTQPAALLPATQPGSPSLAQETVTVVVAYGPSPTPVTLEYVVQIGDTCSEIAARYKVPVARVAALNDLPPDCGVIYAGQKLRIPDEIGALEASSTPQVTSTPAQPLSTQVSSADGMVQVYVPAGEFQMGSAQADAAAGQSEGPLHKVLLRAFWIDLTEVTNAMYAGCVKAGACRPPGESHSKTRTDYYDEPGFKDYPVIYVSWLDAQGYCHWTGRRLPTEAEWEKAARGSDARLYPWGAAPPAARTANFDSQVGDTTRVGSLLAGASPYGALDMAGNVAEWTADWYGADYYRVSEYSNPAGPEQGEFRVLRGGSWFNPARAMRSAFRLWNYPDLRSDTVGFRCAK